MLNTAAPHLERLLLNQTVVILTSPPPDEDDVWMEVIRPRPGTLGRIVAVEDDRVCLEITLPFTDVDGITWYFENDLPEGHHDGLGIHGARTLDVDMPHAAVAVLSAGSLTKPATPNILGRGDVAVSSVVKALAQQRLQDATAALKQVLELLSVGVELNADDDFDFRMTVRDLVAHRVFGRMRSRIEEFFKERPWFWEIRTSVLAQGQDFHVRIEATPEAPNPYQADALDMLGLELTEMLEPECDPLSGRFNLKWENAGHGHPVTCPSLNRGSGLH